MTFDEDWVYVCASFALLHSSHLQLNTDILHTDGTKYTPIRRIT